MIAIILMAVLAVFMFMTNYMKLVGIRLLKKGKVHGIFVIMTMKILFWLSILEIVYIWAPKFIIYALPVVFIIFLVYVFLEKNLFYKAIKGSKEEEAIIK
ncbi:MULTISPECIES: hypothetical protein [Bacillus cereus group]|uniref:Uncharacterized protein n=2 Tax=Bacillus cereus group TaxID=86661 RepID=A0A9X6ZQ56_BACTU|nr:MULTISPECIES: hypothetical protein [Bacillus cereus group]MDA1674633.1 hypothetical protein [Bacillus cereus group sp. TH152-1LC]PDZ94347.1 hypothetical protein CON36_34305 [Bacillus cereus]PFJ29377.1 hypothetical protein COJ15_31810 [Bacillus thuringiensis]PGP12569.1 hypothetical protein COA01_32655 [Bacillus cereus]